MNPDEPGHPSTGERTARSVLGARLRAKPLRYWVTSAIVFVVVFVAKPVIDRRLNLDDLKNFLFVHLAQSPTNPAVPHEVKLVAIGDQAFWGHTLHSRTPTDRHYLARLIRAADKADASVVALDFALLSDDLDRPVRPGDFAATDPNYRDETDDLMRAIAEVADRRRVVLVKGADGPEGGPLQLQSDVFQIYGMCTDLLANGRWRNPGAPGFPLTPAAQRNISCGYITLMKDLRRVPLPATLAGRAERLDSFSFAIARARDPASVARFGEGEYVASYMPGEALHSPHVTVPDATLLSDPARAAETLRGYPLVIGAAWHVNGAGSTWLVDSYDTPIGSVAGALIHVNLAEAVLTNRTYPLLPEWAMLAIETMLGAGAAVLFALAPSALIAGAILAATMPVLLGIQWLSLQLFGTFLDLLAPMVGLGLHAIIDRLIHSGAHQPSATTHQALGGKVMPHEG